MRHCYVLRVFTRGGQGGNHLGVVPDVTGLTRDGMQSIAAELGFGNDQSVGLAVGAETLELRRDGKARVEREREPRVSPPQELARLAREDGLDAAGPVGPARGEQTDAQRTIRWVSGCIEKRRSRR